MRVGPKSAGSEPGPACYGRGGELQIGYWGIELGKLLVERYKIPVFIINGAVGGTRIDMHQRNPEDPEDVTGGRAGGHWFTFWADTPQK